MFISVLHNVALLVALAATYQVAVSRVQHHPLQERALFGLDVWRGSGAGHDDADRVRARADFLNGRARVIHQGYLFGKPMPAEEWARDVCAGGGAD